MRAFCTLCGPGMFEFFSTGGIFLWFFNDYGPEMLYFLHGGIFCMDYGPEMVEFYHRGQLLLDCGLELVEFQWGHHMH